MISKITKNEGSKSRFDNFSEENDIFEYQEFGERLSNLIESFVDKSAVFVLDGEWGSGKSVFVRQFSGLLREKGAAVIQLDAFALDYINDGFVALSGAIHNKSLHVLRDDSNSLERYFSKAKDTAITLLPLGTRIAIRLLSAEILDLDTIKKSGTDISQVLRSISEEGEKAVEAVISEKIRAASNDISTLKEFRTALRDLASDLSTGTKVNDTQYPLVFIVDELDRCKPSFALDIMEKIKHLFDVENVLFVLVANLKQLEASISGLYGTKFDAKTYLEKFYHYRILLPKIHDFSKNKSEIYLRHLFEIQGIDFGSSSITGQFFEFVHLLIEQYDLSLRQIERIVTNIAIVQRAVGERYHIVVPIISGLCVMRTVKPLIYEKARIGQINWADIEGFLSAGNSQDTEYNIENILNKDDLDIWKFVSGMKLSQESSERIGLHFGRIHLRNPKDIIMDMCKFIDEFGSN